MMMEIGLLLDSMMLRLTHVAMTLKQADGNPESVGDLYSLIRHRRNAGNGPISCVLLQCYHPDEGALGEYQQPTGSYQQGWRFPALGRVSTTASAVFAYLAAR